MKKSKKQSRLCFLALALCLCLVISHGYDAACEVFRAYAASTNATVSGYEAQIKDLENKQNQLEKEIASLKNDKAKALQLKLTLDAALGLTYEKISAAKGIISELEKHIEKNTEEAQKLERELLRQEEIFRDRIRFAYEDNAFSYIVLLFESKGLTEFFNNIERVGALLDYDKKVIDKYNKIKGQLQEARSELSQNLEKQNNYKIALEASEKSIEYQIKEADDLLEEIRGNQSAYESDLEKVKAEEKRLEKELEEYLKKLQEAENKNYMVEGQLQWPINKNSYGFNRITSTFGYRDLTVGGNDVSNHKGIDIGVAYQNLYACGSGKVVTSTYSSSYGNYIVIDHGGGVSTLYAHLSKLGVKKGDMVETGEYIGVTGNTGWSSGPHLHLELRISGKPADPLATKDKAGVYYLSRPAKLIGYN